MFNPVIDSMRGLCACTDLPRVREEVSSRHISLGSFSEAQHVFGCERIEKVFGFLAGENRRLRSARGDSATPDITLVDSSVFRAVTRMAWAQWRHQDTEQSAVRLHLKFNLFDSEPIETNITEARRCERKALEEMIHAGEFYVGDCNYGRDYQMLGRFEQADCRYVIRLAENASQTQIESLALDAEDRAAGVVSDQIVRLGAKKCWHHGPVRVIRIEREDMDEPVILVTNCLDRADYSAALIAEIYRQRWAIELFFRWMKCILGRPNQWHWLAESPEGVAIQIYAVLIAALLLSRHLGKLPNKRTMEMLRFHALGMLGHETLEEVLAKALVKKRS